MQAQTNARGWVVRRGKLYEARWVGHDGKRHAKRGFTQRKLAESFARDAAQAKPVADGTLETVDALLDLFLEKHGRTIDPSTAKKLGQQLQKARATFGSRAPESLRRAELEDWQQTLPDGSRHHVFRGFRQALVWAADRGYVTFDPNPTDGVKNPKRKKHERAPIKTFTSWAEIEAVAAELDSRYRAIPIVGAGTGLRSEELFGLNRSDVDMEQRTLTVRRRYTQGVLKDGLKVGSERVVPFGQRVYEALKSLPPRLDSMALFPAPRGGHIDSEAFGRREWGPALRAAGIEHRNLYTLRHTAITWALEAGVPINVVAENAGTSIQQISDTYSRPTDDARMDAAQRIDNYGKAVGE
jgi:integrase